MGVNGTNTYYSVYVETIAQGKTIQFEKFDRFQMQGSRFDMRPLQDSLPEWYGTSTELAAITRVDGIKYFVTDTA